MIRLALRVPAAQAELVLAELLELAPAGVEEVELPVGDGVAAGDGATGMVEFAVYGSPGELPDLPGGLQAAVGGVEAEIFTSELPDDWSERWKRFHRPVLIESPSPGLAGPPALPESPGPRVSGPPPESSSSFSFLSVSVPSLLIRPPWEKESHAGEAEEIVIDPGQAFGTGAHATTSLCLELLLALAAADPARGAVLDVGAGSGVLAIAAAKLGYSPVLALDNERESVAAIESNAAANGVAKVAADAAGPVSAKGSACAGGVEARRFDLRREPLPDVDGAPVVLANLLRPLLFDLAESIGGTAAPVARTAGMVAQAAGMTAATSALRRPAHVIASGLLAEEADEVAAAFAERLGLCERERRQRGEWAALWLSLA